MANNALFWMKINSALMPTPRSCPITEYDMQTSDSGRDESGHMHITQVVGNLIDLDVTWTDLTPAQATLIRSAIAPVNFTVEVHFLGTTIHFRAYKGDRKWTPVFSGDGTADGTVEKWDLSVRLIAV